MTETAEPKLTIHEKIAMRMKEVNAKNEQYRAGIKEQRDAKHAEIKAKKEEAKKNRGKNKLLSCKRIKFENTDDPENSPFVIYGKNGKKKIEGSYKNGKYDGKFEVYNRRGIVVISYTYKEGIKEGPYALKNPKTGLLFKQGQYIDDKREGEAFIYDNKSILLSKENYKNDLLDGERLYYYPDGSERILKKSFYEKDHEMWSLTYYMSGSVLEEKEFNAHGEIVRSIRYMDDGEIIESFITENRVKSA